MVLTDRRVILYDNTLLQKNVQDIHYKYLESVGYGMMRNITLLIIGFILLILDFLLAFSWVLSKNHEISYLFWVITVLIGAISFIIAFFILGKKTVIFKGHNTELKSTSSDEQIIKQARELHQEYLIKTGG